MNYNTKLLICKLRTKLKPEEEASVYCLECCLRNYSAITNVNSNYIRLCQLIPVAVKLVK